jgi:hypothetical protein
VNRAEQGLDRSTFDLSCSFEKPVFAGVIRFPGD